MTRETKKEKAARLQTVLTRMEAFYGDAKPELTFRTPFELLVAVMLSAQCTDKRVNTVTPVFFKKWPTPYELAAADLEEIEDVIRPTGFHHSKAKNLLGAARLLAEKFHGEIGRASCRERV